MTAVMEAGPSPGVRPRTSAGDDGLVECMYERVRPGLLRWLEAITHDEARAEDCCEEAFLRLLSEIRQGHAPDLPAAWLFQVAHNVLVSEARHRRVVEREQPVAMSPAEEVVADPVTDTVVERERVAEVAQALAALDPRDREIVLLAAGGASAAELADRLGISAVAARTRLHRARRRLGEGLANAS